MGAQQQQQPAHRQPQHSSGFTMIPPNESRRHKAKMMAQKEEEELQRWREANRPPAVRLSPEKLGGNVGLSEVREKQQAELRCSKLQRKLKKEELDRRRRQEEEEELQKMKAQQREKAERLEQRRRQEEQRRTQLHREDHHRATESFLQRIERTAPGPLASSSATHTSSRSETADSSEAERRPKSERDVQQDHRRVNSAFLDRLEGRGRESEEGVKEDERPYFTFNDCNVAEQEPPRTHLDTDPEQSWTQEADSDPDYDWALMKLENRFPDCCRVFLEDILDQCRGDYEEAHMLLLSSLS